MRAALLLALAACSHRYDPVACDDPDHTCLQGRVYDSLGGGLDDTRICVLDHDEIPCTVSAKDGSFQLPGLPLEGEVDVTTEREGYARVIFPTDAAKVPRLVWGTYLVSDGLSRLQANKFDVDVVPGTALLLVDLGRKFSDDPIDYDHLAGGTVTLESPASDDLVYLNALFFPDYKLEATSGSGYAAVPNLPEGDALVRAAMPEGSCDLPLASVDPAPGEPVRVPLRADWTTYVALSCP